MADNYLEATDVCPKWFATCWKEWETVTMMHDGLKLMWFNQQLREIWFDLGNPSKQLQQKALPDESS